MSKSLTAEIICVGTELLLGDIVNTNAQDVSQTLAQLGINVYSHTAVGDNLERVVAAVRLAATRADIIITTGGLGPTYDDITKEAVSSAFGVELEYREDEAAKIRAFYRERHPRRVMSESNLRQAWLPRGSVALDNGVGTAPGCAFACDGVHVLMLPGPPRECRDMLGGAAFDYLRKLSDARIFSHNIHIFGIAEPEVEDRLRDLMTNSVNPTLAPYAKDGEVTLRATARAETERDAENLLAPMITEVMDTLGAYVYGVDTGSLSNTVVGLLRSRLATLAVAESCTGGLIAKRITDVPGASRCFKGGVTAYTSEAKTALVGVPAELIAEHGVVSGEVAAALANGVREKFGTDIGVGVTGVAGPGADDDANPAGLVYIAVSTADETITRERNFLYDRDRVRIIAASTALDMVRRVLLGLEIAE
ncbi:MAG: competence/damage-inducible protein A [Oscillospiraceae bacterium]|jgi:nicotinamide-nucleotide amidase|nr:competence/damage-inducible protein A [Oscillospiraceae bacterium]